MGDQSRPERRGPAMGAADGVRRDIQAAKDSGVAYDPRGAGVAWTHDFLNKKPWHPMNFRNQARVWEAEQQHLADERRKQIAKEEFEAEQEYLKTVSMLSAEEQDKYKQRQSVSWLYMKPPGYDAALGRTVPPEPREGDGDLPTSILNPKDATPQELPPQGRGQKSHGNNRRSQNGGNHVARVVDGVKAMMKQQFELKQCRAAPGLSPPRGGIDPSAENQRFVVAEIDSEEEEEAFRVAMMPVEERTRLRREAIRECKRRKKEEEQRKIKEAKAFLRAAGLSLSEDSHSSDLSGSVDDIGSRDNQKRNRGKYRKKSKRANTNSR